MMFMIMIGAIFSIMGIILLGLVARRLETIETMVLRQTGFIIRILEVKSASIPNQPVVERSVSTRKRKISNETKKKQSDAMKAKWEEKKRKSVIPSPLIELNSDRVV